MIAGLGDDGASPGMADHENGAFLHVDDPVGGRDIIGEETQGVLNSESFQSSFRKERDYLGPARAIRESSVYKHDGTNCHDTSPFAQLECAGPSPNRELRQHMLRVY